MADMTPEEKEKRAAALQDSYSKTTAWLIEKYKSEFDEHRAALLAEKGITWTPKLTQEQKDEQALKDLLDRNPKLLDSVLKVGPQTVEPTSITGPAAVTDPHS